MIDALLESLERTREKKLRAAKLQKFWAWAERTVGRPFADGETAVLLRLLHPLDDGWEPYWLDTFQLLEGRTARIAFQADNPGRWLISATALERFDTGLWTSFEVT